MPTHRLSCQAIRQLIQGDETSGLSMSFDPDPRRQRDDERSAADGDVAAADHDGDDYDDEGDEDDDETSSLVSSCDLDDWSRADVFLHRPGLRRHSSPLSPYDDPSAVLELRRGGDSETLFGDFETDIALDEQLTDDGLQMSPSLAADADDFAALTAVLDAVSASVMFSN